MKTFTFIFIFQLTLFTNLLANINITNNDLDFLRNTYYSAVENKDDIDKLYNFIVSKFGKSTKDYPPIIISYMAGIEALKSKHAFWITTKYDYFLKAMDLFEKAIALDPNNLEIRFMRFSVLHYVPSILGYSSERGEDLLTIYNLLSKKNYSSVPKDIQLGMVQFLLDSDRLSQKQFLELNKIKIELANL